MSDLALIVDDDDLVRKTISKIVRSLGFDVMDCADIAEALDLFQVYHPQIAFVILDQALPDTTGTKALPKFLAISPNIPILMVTGKGSAALAVEALRLGAVDFLEKPIDREKLKVACLSAAKRNEIDATQSGDGVATGRLSAVMRDLYATVDRIKDIDVAVLITGESGVGKDVLARYIHEQSARAEHPFEAINCAAIPRDLLESELFGHEKGAFTGADKAHEGRFVAAGKGTIFLDELGELPLELQPKLLRAVQDGMVQPLGGRPVEIRARLVSATNRNLKDQVARGDFREDLYYRVNQFSVEVPPLRERKSEIPVLVEHFLAEAGGMGIRSQRFSEGALQILHAYDWPGNIRQLKNVVVRAAILAGEGEIEPRHLPAEILDAANIDIAAEPVDQGISQTAAGNLALPQQPDDIIPLEEVERAHIEAAVAACNGNMSEAAKRLGIGRATLYRKLN